MEVSRAEREDTAIRKKVVKREKEGEREAMDPNSIRLRRTPQRQSLSSFRVPVTPDNDGSLPITTASRSGGGGFRSNSTIKLSCRGWASIVLLTVLILSLIAYHSVLQSSLSLSWALTNQPRSGIAYTYSGAAPPYSRYPHTVFFGADFVRYISIPDSFRPPYGNNLYAHPRSRLPDFGGVHVRIFESNVVQVRQIYRHPDDIRMYDELEPTGEDDQTFADVGVYYAFDDDTRRNPLNEWSDDTIQDQKHCRRTAGHRKLFINCNSLHEFDIQYRFRSGDTKYLTEGSFREVYRSDLPHDHSVVFKAYVWDSNFEYADFEYQRMDALVAERLTGHSNIVDIYGFCGTAQIVEAMNNGDISSIVTPKGYKYTYEGPEEDLVVLNKLTGHAKLRIALEMAESIATLHGYEEYLIVHDDIKLNQFLLDDNRHVKLNDFNRAEIMLWNEEDQEYCRYRNGKGPGIWRSPEEYKDIPLNEKIDVWSMCNNLYALLTGLKPLYRLGWKEIPKRIAKGETGWIDPRFQDKSFGDAQLAQIIPKCWAFDADDRISIFELVAMLREAVEKDKKLKRQEKDRRKSGDKHHEGSRRMNALESRWYV